LIAAWAVSASLATGAVAWTAVGDGIPAPLAGQQGDATRGAALVADRARSLCLLCHQAAVTGPHAPAALQGTLSTDLRGAGTRWSAAQLRLRVADSRRLNPASLMPTLHAAAPSAADEAEARVGAAWRGQPVLSAQELEDIVAWLETQR
jgi:sulfur-oxidizing protein SoxX